MSRKQSSTGDREPPRGVPEQAIGVPKHVHDGASQSVLRAIAAVNEAKKLNDQLQAQYKTDTAQWHQCESIDDKLHDALTALGD